MTQLIRTNPGLAITLALMAGCILVCTLLGVVMARSGASLRPVYWFAGFFALIAVPQFIGHLFKATHAATKEAPRAVALQNLTTSTNAENKRADARSLFGPDVDAQLIVDARNTFGGAFANAESAQFATLPNGDTVLIAKFGGYLAAEKAWVAYLRESGLNQLAGKGDSQRGYAVTRPAGDRAYVLHLDNMVGVWSGRDDAAIRKRMVAGGFEIPRRAPLEGTENITAPARAGLNLPTAVVVGALALYLFLVVLYFFKGAAWAGSRPPKTGGAPESAGSVASRIESINSLDVPFRIERGESPNEFIATWRYADAKWVDLARARGMRRTFKIRLTLDERRRVARAIDYAASYEWSAGRGGAELRWQASLGIVFFQYEHQRVFGLQLDDSGRFQPQLAYAYTFNLDEMKSPLIEAVTRAGWTWRPTVWQGPRWLRWLTE